MTAPVLADIPVLEVRGLCQRFGATEVLHQLNLQVRDRKSVV